MCTGVERQEQTVNPGEREEIDRDDGGGLKHDVRLARSARHVMTEPLCALRQTDGELAKGCEAPWKAARAACREQQAAEQTRGDPSNERPRGCKLRRWIRRYPVHRRRE